MVAKWKWKAFVQRSIGRLPYPHFWNRMMQRHVSGTLRLSKSSFESRLRHAARHLDNWRTHGRTDRDPVAFEVGTGWHPVVPIAFFLCGAAATFTFDIAPHLTLHQVRETLTCFLDSRDRLKEWLPAIRPERLDSLAHALDRDRSRTGAELLRRFQIILLVGDARVSGLPAGSIELAMSTEVLEYIPAEVIKGIFEESRRLLAPGGVMSHLVDLSDEYAYFDRSIPPLHFLRYSDAEWQRYESPLIPHNRLRLPAYRSLLHEAGFGIADETNIRTTPEILGSIPVSPQFADCPEDDLLVLQSWLTAVAAADEHAPAS